MHHKVTRQKQWSLPLYWLPLYFMHSETGNSLAICPVKCQLHSYGESFSGLLLSISKRRWCSSLCDTILIENLEVLWPLGGFGNRLGNPLVIKSLYTFGIKCKFNFFMDIPVVRWVKIIIIIIIIGVF